MSGFAPRTAVVTGGASGIGRAVAARLAMAGTQVMLADLPGDRLKEATASIDGALAQPCDVSDSTQIDALADSAFGQLGTVELLFNNAGVGGPRGRLWEVDPQDARAHFEVNFWGVWHGCRVFAPRMIAQDCASAIYNTGSENSFFCAMPKSAAYIAAKHAVLGLTENLREDMPDHVHTGLVVPGWVHTAIGDERFMKHGMDVEQFAAIVVPQMLARERFVVSHYSNVRRIGEWVEPLLNSYESNAVRDEMDVRDVIAGLRAARD